MEKKKYSTPAVSVMALQQQDMLCGSPGSMGIHDEYTDAEQLSNRNIWDEIWLLLAYAVLPKFRIKRASKTGRNGAWIAFG